MNTLDGYVLEEPSGQAVLDIFEGEWSSRLPQATGLITTPGTAGLFEDPRIVWAEQVLGPFAGLRVLELGPLEGGHSYMLQARGADHVISIEANVRAFLKCLCIKELFSLNRVEYRLGDFMEFLRTSPSRFDLVVASGVLYHMQQPLELLDLLAKATDRLFIWTHYYDEAIIANRQDLSRRFSHLYSTEYAGLHAQYSIQLYGDSRNVPGFCGGPESASKWLTRESILRALEQLGLIKIQIAFDDPAHPNGPAFAICATK